MRRQDKVEKSKTSWIIFLTAVTTIIVLVFSISKYTTTLADADSAIVAMPIMNLSSSNSLELQISPTDEEKTYILQISNYLDSQTSEVSMNYYIQITSLGNLPLEFKLYTYENETIGDTDLLEGNGNMTDQIEMGFDQKTIHSYALKISWKSTETSYQYAGEIDYIDIIVRSEQID